MPVHRHKAKAHSLTGTSEKVRSMKGVFQFVAPLAAGVLIALSGMLHAVQTEAWELPRRLATAAEQLHDVPPVVGEWHSREITIEPSQLKAAEAAGGIARIYEHPSGERVNILLLCGPTGPIAVHPPTVCFTAAGYEQVTPQQRFVLTGDDGRPAAFWMADFERGIDGVPVRIRTYWGWSFGEGWKAPEHSRLAFAGTGVLNKLYVTYEVPRDRARVKPTSEPVSLFLKAFLPEVDRALFSTASQSSVF
jgi:hypothetical protein